MAKKKPKKRIDLRRPIRHREGEVPVPAFHAQMIVKSAPGLTVKHTERAVRQVDETRRLITFVASEEVVDRDGDIVRSAGIDTINYRKNPVLLVDHDSRRPIGKTRDLRLTAIDGHPALIGEAELLARGASPVADAVWKEIVGGVRAAVSIGFLLKDFEPRFEQGRPVGRILREVELLEISSVVLPSCPSCLVTATSGVKSCCSAHEPAAIAARIQETLRKSEQLMTKLAVQEFERLRERAERDTALPFGYSFVLKGALPRIERAAARFASWAAADLGIQAATVRLFRASRAGESPDFRMDCKAIGAYFPFPDHTIAVDGSLGPEALAETCAHEIAHAAGADEREAEAFARKFLATTYTKMVGGGLRTGYPMPGTLQDQTPVIVTSQTF